MGDFLAIWDETFKDNSRCFFILRFFGNANFFEMFKGPISSFLPFEIPLIFWSTVKFTGFSQNIFFDEDVWVWQKSNVEKFSGKLGSKKESGECRRNNDVMQKLYKTFFIFIPAEI